MTTARPVGGGDLRRTVLRAVVHDEDLPERPGAADPLECLVDDVPDGLFLVQAGDDDGDLGLGRHGSGAPPTVAALGARSESARAKSDRARSLKAAALRRLYLHFARVCRARSLKASLRGRWVGVPVTRSRIRWPRAEARARVALTRAVCRRVPSGPALVAAALAVYALVSVALPLAPGRDLGRYLVVYAQLFDDHVVYPYALASRTPGTPLVVGGLLEAGPLVAEIGAAALYALSILAWCAAARRFGPAAAIATAAALLLYPGYVTLFHRLSSDAVFAAAFALVAWLLARTPRAA